MNHDSGRHDGMSLGETLLKMQDEKKTYTQEWKDLVKCFGIKTCEQRLEKAIQDRKLKLASEGVEKPEEEVREPEEFEF